MKPTIEELDAEINEKGLDDDLGFLPEGPISESFREQIPFTVKLSKYKLVLEDVVLVDGKKVKGFINPLADTEFNISKFLRFLERVLNAAAKRL